MFHLIIIFNILKKYVFLFEPEMMSRPIFPLVNKSYDEVYSSGAQDLQLSTGDYYVCFAILAIQAFLS